LSRSRRSDARLQERATGTTPSDRPVAECRLCKQTALLCYSHIYPEWTYEEYYDEKHKYVSIPRDPTRGESDAQKGIREYLLCRECEERFNVYETHAAQLVRGIRAQLLPNVSRLEVPGCDYTKTKLFVMSVLWRASIATVDFFAPVNLGPREELLRRMLLEANPGEPHEFGFMVRAFPKAPDARTMMHTPRRHRINQQSIWELQMAGLHWYVLASSLARVFANDGVLARPGNPLVVSLSRKTDADVIAKFRRMIQASGRKLN
jgi:hypothetical protein